MKNLIHFFSYRSTVLVVVLTVLVHVSRPGFSQQIDWVVYDTVSYSLNPAFSSIPAAVGPDKSLSTPFLRGVLHKLCQRSLCPHEQMMAL